MICTYKYCIAESGNLVSNAEGAEVQGIIRGIKGDRGSQLWKHVGMWYVAVKYAWQ